jgi:hypothetical protein
MVFASSDNSNPRTNRRAYEARGWIEPDLVNVGLAVLLIAAAAARMLAHMGRQMAKARRRPPSSPRTAGDVSAAAAG